MLSDFHQLSEKIASLAELTKSLRRENADLRLELASLASENTDLKQRIDEASRRVAALLDQIPSANKQDEEAA
jgi:regulator of replication initiation timing